MIRHVSAFILAILLSPVATIAPGYHQQQANAQATAPVLQSPQPPPQLEQIRNLIRVPLVSQTTDHTCGVAALQAILLYYGEEDYSQSELARHLGANPKNGTSYRAILRFANRKFSDPRKRNFLMWKRCGMTIDDLRQVIDSGRPPILVFQAWAQPGTIWKKEWNEGHYAVAVGYDEINIYFMDPSVIGHYSYVPVDEFLDRWHDKDPETGEKLIQCGLVIGNDTKNASYDIRIIKRID